MDSNLSHTQFPPNSAQHDVMKMKILAPQQFEELNISHLSRRLDLNDGKLDEIMNGKVKHISRKNCLFKISSPFILKKQKSGMEKEDPMTDLEIKSHVVSAIIKLILSLNNPTDLQVEGIFRKSGSFARHKELKERILTDCNVDLTPYTSHDRANVIKYLLADLPDCLLLGQHFEAFRQAMELHGETEVAQQSCLRVIQLLLLHLPPNNMVITERLLLLLSSVAQEPVNKMDSKALGTLFAPHLLCNKRMQSDPVFFNSVVGTAMNAITFMIDNGSKIFEVPSEFHRDVVNFLRSEKHLSNLPADPCTPVRSASEIELSPVNSSLSFSARSQEIKSTTEQELAKLKAHLQTLSDEEKQKITKQLKYSSLVINTTPSSYHETPCKHRDSSRKHHRSKSLGFSIKKRLLHLGNKSKRQTPNSFSIGSFKLVNVDYKEEPSAKTALVDSPAKLSDSPAPNSQLKPLNRRRHRHHSDVDATPPKVQNTEHDPISNSSTLSPANEEMFTDCIFPLSQKERMVLHACRQQNRDVKVQNLVQGLSPHSSPVNYIDRNSPQRCHSRSREPCQSHGLRPRLKLESSV